MLCIEHIIIYGGAEKILMLNYSNNKFLRHLKIVVLLLLTHKVTLSAEFGEKFIRTGNLATYTSECFAKDPEVDGSGPFCLYRPGASNVKFFRYGLH